MSNTDKSNNIASNGSLTVAPMPIKVGLTISYDNESTFFFNSDNDINITSVDVKAISSAYTAGNSGIIWIEKDDYTFITNKLIKLGFNKVNSRYQHSLSIKLLDSSWVSCSQKDKPTLYLRFYIYYTIEGRERRIIANTTNPEKSGIGGDNGEPLIYKAKDYRLRATYPYSLQLDSIYRPFFFNSVLLFLDSNTNDNILTGDTYGRFYFSIANGCTFRDDNKSGRPLYKLGDINLKISNIDNRGVEVKESVYDLKLKDNYRIFSEIEDFNDGESKRNESLKKAHKRGFRECGTDDGSGGIFLPEIKKNSYLIGEQYFIDENLTPSSIDYKIVDRNGVVNNIDVYELNSTSQKFNINQALNVNFSVSDGSPDGINYKTISVECSYLKFANKIEKKDKKILLDYNEYGGEIDYILLNDSELSDFMKRMGSISVEDRGSIGVEDKYKDIFTYIHKYKPLVFKYIDESKKFETEFNKDFTYVLGIHKGWYEIDETTTDYIKHTNKLLILKLYKI